MNWTLAEYYYKPGVNFPWAERFPEGYTQKTKELHVVAFNGNAGSTPVEARFHKYLTVGFMGMMHTPAPPETLFTKEDIKKISRIHIDMCVAEEFGNYLSYILLPTVTHVIMVCYTERDENTLTDEVPKLSQGAFHTVFDVVHLSPVSKDLMDYHRFHRGAKVLSTSKPTWNHYTKKLFESTFYEFDPEETTSSLPRT